MPVANKDEQDSGKSVPEQTNTDNPSKTGVPSVDSQGGGPANEPVRENPGTTKTRPYGGGNYNDPGPNVDSPSLHDLAVRQVEEAYGPDAHNNPTFKERVKDVEAQMRESVEHTKHL